MRFAGLEALTELTELSLSMGALNHLDPLATITPQIIDRSYASADQQLQNLFGSESFPNLRDLQVLLVDHMSESKVFHKLAKEYKGLHSLGVKLQDWQLEHLRSKSITEQKAIAKAYLEKDGINLMEELPELKIFIAKGANGVVSIELR
jgi:hypothetical protein